MVGMGIAVDGISAPAVQLSLAPAQPVPIIVQIIPPLPPVSSVLATLNANAPLFSTLAGPSTGKVVTCR